MKFELNSVNLCYIVNKHLSTDYYKVEISTICFEREKLFVKVFCFEDNKKFWEYAWIVFSDSYEHEYVSDVFKGFYKPEL